MIKLFEQWVNEKKAFKVTRNNKLEATEVLNKWFTKGGFKFPYMVANAVVSGKTDLSKVKHTMTQGYGMSEDDFYELADLKPGVLQNIYDRYQAKANADWEQMRESAGEGLIFNPSSQKDLNKMRKALETSDLYAEYIKKEDYFFFPENSDQYDELESQIEELTKTHKISGYIESI